VVEFAAVRRGALLALAILGALGVAACGDDDDGESVPEEVAALPSEDELRAGLLTIEEMPTGWAEVESDGSDDPLCDIRLADLLGLEVERLPSAGAVFAEDEDLGPLFGETLGFVPDGSGPDVIPLVRTAFGECEGDRIEGLDASVTELSFPTVGDESVAYRVRLEDPETERAVDFDVVYSRTDDLLVVAHAYDLFGDATAILEEYAPLAVDKAVNELL
jgi:hypothetical protein